MIKSFNIIVLYKMGLFVILAVAGNSAESGYYQ